MSLLSSRLSFFFFNDTATTEIYTLSLHDALPISLRQRLPSHAVVAEGPQMSGTAGAPHQKKRSEEHTSELQSQSNLVCRLLLEKKKKKHIKFTAIIMAYAQTPESYVGPQDIRATD